MSQNNVPRIEAFKSVDFLLDEIRSSFSNSSGSFSAHHVSLILKLVQLSCSNSEVSASSSLSKVVEKNDLLNALSDYDVSNDNEDYHRSFCSSFLNLSSSFCDSILTSKVPNTAESSTSSSSAFDASTVATPSCFSHSISPSTALSECPKVLKTFSCAETVFCEQPQQQVRISDSSCTLLTSDLDPASIFNYINKELQTAEVDTRFMRMSGNVAKLNVFLLTLCHIKKKEKTIETKFEDKRDLRQPSFRAFLSFPSLCLNNERLSVFGEWQGSKMLAKENACYRALIILEPLKDMIEEIVYHNKGNNNNNNNTNNNTNTSNTSNNNSGSLNINTTNNSNANSSTTDASISNINKVNHVPSSSMLTNNKNINNNNNNSQNSMNTAGYNMQYYNCSNSSVSNNYHGYFNNNNNSNNYPSCYNNQNANHININLNNKNQNNVNNNTINNNNNSKNFHMNHNSYNNNNNNNNRNQSVYTNTNNPSSYNNNNINNNINNSHNASTTINNNNNNNNHNLNNNNNGPSNVIPIMNVHYSQSHQNLHQSIPYSTTSTVSSNHIDSINSCNISRQNSYHSTIQHQQSNNNSHAVVTNSLPNSYATTQNASNQFYNPQPSHAPFSIMHASSSLNLSESSVVSSHSSCNQIKPSISLNLNYNANSNFCSFPSNNTNTDACMNNISNSIHQNNSINNTSTTTTTTTNNNNINNINTNNNNNNNNHLTTSNNILLNQPLNLKSLFANDIAFMHPDEHTPMTTKQGSPNKHFVSSTFAAVFDGLDG